MIDQVFLLIFISNLFWVKLIFIITQNPSMQKEWMIGVMKLTNAFWS